MKENDTDIVPDCRRAAGAVSQ